MHHLVQRLAELYDLVVIDTPPLLAVSDALILARMVDKVVFVVRWARTRRDSSAVALRQLMETGADVAGIVLSQVDTRRHATYEFSRTSHYFDAYHKYYAD
jgi:Mrp family chromosome partitioning ATPase